MVKGHQYIALQVVSPEHSEEVESLLCFFNDRCGVGGPGEVIRDAGSQESESSNPLQIVPADEEWDQVDTASSEVQYEYGI